LSLRIALFYRDHVRLSSLTVSPPNVSTHYKPLNTSRS
jgi:hypothetical protein